MCIRDRVRAMGFDPMYYVYHDSVSQLPYSPYKESEKGVNIWVVDEAGEIIELSQVSEIVAAMTRADLKQDEKIYYPNDQVARAGRKKQ